MPVCDIHELFLIHNTIFLIMDFLAEKAFIPSDCHHLNLQISVLGNLMDQLVQM